MATTESQDISGGEDGGHLKPLCSTGRNANWCGSVENRMGVSQKIKNRIPRDPAILLLGVYAKESKAGTQRDICALSFTTAPFTAARKEKSTNG